MAAVSTSPSQYSNTSTSNHRLAREAPLARKPLDTHNFPVSDQEAQLRDSSISPVQVNLQQDNWAQPSSADIAHMQSRDATAGLADHMRNARIDPAQDASSTPPHSSSNMPLDTLNEHDPASFLPDRDPNLSPASTATPDRYEANMASPKERVRNQELNRNSRESDETASTNPQLASTESSATSASSFSGINENAECPPIGESPGSSVFEGNMPLEPVPQLQYHHEQPYPPRVSSASNDDDRRASNPEFHDGANIGRHLTPNSGYNRRSSLPRPQSSISDFGARGRSPNLVPGASHMRSPSQSRRSPDVRPASYAELLNVPYSSQQAPAPLTLDNSNLRTVIGNNASLLSAQKTLDMYRQNVKKTNDFSIQYSFAIFLISTAQEQGLDFEELKPRKISPKPQKGRDSPAVEGSISNPQELVREARQILQRLANGGYPFAQYYLADGYASGLFSKGKEDYNSAFPLFVLAAKHGHAESGYRTALCYEFGWGCRKDAAKAVQFLRAAASKRHPGAMTRLGKACLSGDLGEKRYREGIKWMKHAAEAADVQYNTAPYQLGCLYETGYGDDIFQDASYAAELFTQAAELGHIEASFRLGDAYEHGRLNCPRDVALSVHFYTGAAERGHPGAMMGLCAWYMVGAPPILEKDEEEAYEWARRSADLGYVKAQYAVGYFKEMGIGCLRDVLEANVWYVKAADAGDERAKQRLAIIQAAVSGEGKPMDVAPPRNGKIQKGIKDDKDCIVM